jgi:hypothetical protein
MPNSGKYEFMPIHDSQTKDILIQHAR